MKKFVIITVCLNVEDLIAETISSILNQTCSDFEYLIKDGVSNDRTVEIAESFAPAFAEKKIPYRVVSMPDRGIYDAMNQAVDMTEGEWILYMNAGDQMADDYVLEMLAQSHCLETADIVYGDCIDQDDPGYLYRKARPLEKIRDRLPFSHQSVFARRELYAQMHYSLKYRLCSDYAFFYHWYRAQKRFAYIPIAISIYDRHGISSNGKRVIQELLQIQEDLPVRDEEVIRMLQNEAASYDQKPPVYRRILSAMMPNAIREKRWGKKRRQYGWKTREEFFEEKRKNGGHVNIPT